MLDLYKLTIFVCVADVGSFSRASEQLLMTQPGVSQHIRDLEHSLGAKLFDRGRRGVALTTSGELLYPYARQILDLVAEVEGRIVEVNALSEGRVCLGATPGVSIYILAELIQTFGRHFPKLSVSLETNITPHIIEILAMSTFTYGFNIASLSRQDEALGLPIS
ncbi:MAG: LysR family transcriptional regulator [Chloroflexota bacterium]